MITQPSHIATAYCPHCRQEVYLDAAEAIDPEDPELYGSIPLSVYFPLPRRWLLTHQGHEWIADGFTVQLVTGLHVTAPAGEAANPTAQ